MRSAFSLLLLFAALHTATPSPAAGADTPHRMISRAELLAAMQQHGDYDPAVTTNGARFQVDVLLHLARKHRELDPDGPPLRTDSDQWFANFLSVTGLPEQEAPIYARLSYENKQRTEIDYRRDRVIDGIVEGPTPELAANVVIWWPQSVNSATEYTYYDTLSSPHLQVTDHRIITYRLLAFPDGVIVYDEITGVSGMPTTGVLGLIFRLIGEGRIVRSRMAIASDGLQVCRADTRKGFLGRTTTITVYPNGRTEEGTPDNRPDLARLENRLKTRLKIEYVPFDLTGR